MANQNNGKNVDATVGKGNITPVMIAFIVDRYLAENNCTNALSAFRAEAGDLLSKTKGKEAPKGLMGLGDILNEYISLKAQKLKVDQDKQRVEMAMQGIQEVMRIYHSAAGVTLSPSPPLLSPQNFATQLPQSFLPNPSYGSPSGHTIHHGSPLINYRKLPIPPLKAAEPNSFSTPVSAVSSATRKRTEKSAPRFSNPPKKSRTQQPIDSSTTEDKTLFEQVTSTNNTELKSKNLSAVQSTSINDDPIIGSPAHGPSVAKNLFKQLLETRANSSSPRTPPRAFAFQSNQSVTSPENQSRPNNGASTPRDKASSSHSLISSQTIILSPLKGTECYAIERRYHVTASPFKSSPQKLRKREHVKGKLCFDEPDVSKNLETPVASEGYTPSTDLETQGMLDYDLTDLDIFNGDISFSEILAGIDLECGGAMPSSCQTASGAADFLPSSQHDESNELSEANQILSSGTTLSKITRFCSSTDLDIQGPNSVTSVRAITKRIKISSPAKPRSSCAEDRTGSPGTILKAQLDDNTLSK